MATLDLDISPDFIAEQYSGGGAAPAIPQAPTVTTTFGNDLFTASDAAAARTVLGLGSLSTQAANNVAITGGSINGTPIGSTARASVKGTDVDANSAFRFNGVQVVNGRKPGWAAATGTATRTTFDTTTVTLPDVAERVKALIDDLIAHGLIGP